MGLQPSFYVRETDQNCPQKNQPANTSASKIWTQRVINGKKNFKASKAPVSTSNWDSEPSKKGKKKQEEEVA